MTTASNDRSTGPYSTNGVTTSFQYDFKILTSSQLKVFLTDTTTGAVTEVSTSLYSVTGAGSVSGGNVVFTTAPSSGYNLTIKGNTTLSQETDLPEGGTFPASSVEDGLDKLTFISQEVQEKLGRALLLSPEVAGGSYYVPSLTDNAGKFIRVNTGETNYEYADIVTLGAVGVPVTIANGGTGSITGEITILEGSSRTVKVQESTTTTGNDFTIQAGDAYTAGTNLSGGTLILSSGSSEGTGTGSVQIRAAKAGSSGSTQNTPQTAVTVDATNVSYSPHGTSAGNTLEQRFLELVANGSNYVGFKAPDSISSNSIFTLPSGFPGSTQYLSSTSAGVLAFASIRDKIKQIVFTDDSGAQTSTSATIPYDDTVPQNSEGIQHLTVSITPTSASSKILIIHQGTYLNSAAAGTTVALFRDSGASAINAVSYFAGAGETVNVSMVHVADASSTSSTSFVTRFGGNSGSVYTNGVAGNRRLGGVNRCYLIAIEYEV